MVLDMKPSENGFWVNLQRLEYICSILLESLLFFIGLDFKKMPFQFSLTARSYFSYVSILEIL